MKITAIKTQNFIGARDVDVKLTKPICLFAGKNFSGKSSLQEAVRMALTGESVRVSLKKEYGRMLTESQTVGYAVVEHDGQQSAITLPNGAHEHTGNDRLPAVLPYVLDAQRFSSLPANDRRAFLFGLMGLRTDGDTVGGRMLTKGATLSRQMRSGRTCAPASTPLTKRRRTGREKPRRPGGRPPAKHTGASRLRRGRPTSRLPMATGCAWRAKRTGQSRRADRARRRRNRRDAIRRRGRQHKATNLPACASAPRGMPASRPSFARHEAELQEWQAKVEHEARKGGKQMPAEPTYTCPACSAVLRHSHANGALVEFTPPPIVYPTSEPGKLAEYQRARDLLDRSVENDKRDLAAADLAARTLAEIDDARSDPAPAPEEIEAKKVKLAEARKEQTRLAGVVKYLESDERAAAIADKNTDLARGHHRDVAQWEEIAAALAPNRIPGKFWRGARADQSTSRVFGAHDGVDTAIGRWRHDNYCWRTAICPALGVREMACRRNDRRGHQPLVWRQAACAGQGRLS
ncbi:MAG: AAA family ATPase [Candidatus Accumulibacter sp.]|nr:AAA family ATPase [Accumulibacter sp.]